MTRVLIDARLAIRGLGIATFIERLMAGFSADRSPAPQMWRGAGEWGPAGLASTLAHSGPFDISPRLDPRTRPYDVVHFASNLGAYRPGPNSVVTVHDLMHRHRARRRDRLTGALLEHSLLRAGRVVAISERTKGELEVAFPALKDKVAVIPHGMRSRPLPTTPRTHLLAFGGAADPRKRVDLMVAAYRAYRTGTPDALPLVVLARAGLDPAQRHELSELGARIVASATASEVDDLMEQAGALLYTTREEGFGLPILEAAEVGTPVVLDAAAIVAAEVMGSHCFGVSDTTAEAWAEALRRAVAAGPVVSPLKLPDWPAVAAQYRAVYAEVDQT